MNFKDILPQAQVGRETAVEELLTRYRPLLVKESIYDGVFDEELYQELCLILLKCIHTFRI
ncbi:MAG: helix-turn-helix domain-containing protein [Lachnospiraceae bacterium]|nr:helix-turn-helix domain-containing protein [Lachnospiraceae bacterium]